MRNRGTVATVATAATVAALLLMTGCSSSTTDAAPTASVDPAKLVTQLPAATTSVDSVTWGLVEGEPLSLAPGSDFNFVEPNLCDSLLALQPDFTIKPGIAEKADWVNPVTFQIDLRPGVTFWDGSPLTPADVVYTLERSRQDVTSAFFGAFVLVKSIDVTGPSQVTVAFKAPDSTFRDAMTGGAGAIMEKAFSEKAGKGLGTATGGLMCTGPYKLDSWTPGTQIVTSANEHYWAGAPKVKKLTYKFVSDGTTLTNALLSGEIDGAYTVPVSSRGAFQSSTKGRLVVGPSTASYSFGPTRPDGPGANAKIRQALNLAIDRRQFISTVLQGLGQPQKTFVAPFSWAGQSAASVYQAGYDALPSQKVDLAAAKKLVQESGVDTASPIKLAIPAGSKELSQAAAIIQAAAQSIGLKAEIDEMQATDYSAIFLPDPSNRAGIDFVVTTGYTETPGVLTYPQLFVLPPAQGGIFNWTNYDDPEAVKNVQAARTDPDATGAAQSYVAAQKVFAPDLLQVTLAGSYHLTFLNDRLTGVVTSVAAYASPWALHLGGK